MPTPTSRRVLRNILLPSVAALLIVACSKAAKEPPRAGASAAKSQQADMSSSAPQPLHELRGLFVTTAHNTDWPSQAGLNPIIQRNEIDAIIQRAKDLNCNAIFLQVRAFGDRMHRLKEVDEDVPPNPPEVNEPWAMTLNHSNDPEYDPLGTWILKAHANGMQLHAWINPYRTDSPITYQGQVLPFFSPPDRQHLYLDPTSLKVQEYLVKVFEQILDRYPPGWDNTASITKDAVVKSTTPTPTTATTQPEDDDGIDGIVVDHYTPDPNDSEPVNTAQAMTTGGTGGTGGQRSWSARPKPNPRIEWLLTKHKVPKPYNPVGNAGAGITQFIELAFNKVDQKKRKFGLSPLHEQRNDARVKEWVQKRFCHYLIPELYLRPADFDDAVDEWQKLVDNPSPGVARKKPLLAPALFASAVEVGDSAGTIWPSCDIETEIDKSRGKKVGQVYFTARALRPHAHGGPPDEVGEKVKQKYRHASAVPRMGVDPSSVPTPTVTEVGDTVEWDVTGSGRIREWLVTFRKGGTWEPWQKFHRKIETTAKLPGADAVAVQAIDKDGNASAVKQITITPI